MNTFKIAMYAICVPIALGLGTALTISLFYGLGYVISKMLDKLNTHPGSSEPRTMILRGFLACILIAVLVMYIYNSIHH